MYSIVSDVNSYSEFLPFCTGSKVIGPAPEQEHNTLPAANAVPDERLLAELGVGFKNLREQYTSLVEMRQGEWVKVSRQCPLHELNAIRRGGSILRRTSATVTANLENAHCFRSLSGYCSSAPSFPASLDTVEFRSRDLEVAVHTHRL